MVKWTPHARRQLRHIHDYIAQDSQHYAKRLRFREPSACWIWSTSGLTEPLVIPAEMRRRLGLGEGDLVLIEETTDGLAIRR